MNDQTTASTPGRQPLSAEVQNLSAFVWSIAEILRGDFKQSEYGKVILPFVVMRRLDCILEDSKDAVLAAEKSIPESADEATLPSAHFQPIKSRSWHCGLKTY